MKHEYVEYYAVGEENKDKFIESVEKAVTRKGEMDFMKFSLKI